MREGEDCDVETCFWVEQCSDLAALTGHQWIILVRDQITNCISGGTGGAADLFSRVGRGSVLTTSWSEC
jgi:hypothetical protein